MAEVWTEQELELIVADYFQMLWKDLLGKRYVKAEHRRALQEHLNNRSDGSIEFKYMNISGVLADHGFLWLSGYRPAVNYQRALAEEVLEQLRDSRSLTEKFEEFVEEAEVQKPELPSWKEIQEDPPEPAEMVQEKAVGYGAKGGFQGDYLKREQQNKRLGELGEDLVMKLEDQRLREAGKKSWGEKIEWTAKEKGDGAGYDIRSWNTDGSERFIEVKTTRLDKLAPIYFSHNELEVSQAYPDHYHLYRLFHFSQKKPGLFTKQGSFDRICRMEATEYRGHFGAS